MTYQLAIERLTPRAWVTGKREDWLTVKMADWMTKELTELQTRCLTDRETDEMPGWVNYGCVKHGMIDRQSGQMADFSSLLSVRRIFFYCHLSNFSNFCHALFCFYLSLTFPPHCLMLSVHWVSVGRLSRGWQREWWSNDTGSPPHRPFYSTNPPRSEARWIMHWTYVPNGGVERRTLSDSGFFGFLWCTVRLLKCKSTAQFVFITLSIQLHCYTF